jgi:hypothetical protein
MGGECEKVKVEKGNDNVKNVDLEVPQTYRKLIQVIFQICTYRNVPEYCVPALRSGASWLKRI